MTSLLILLGVALSSLTVCADMLPQPGFDVNQLMGTWYYIGAASDEPWFEKEKSNLRLNIWSLYAFSHGDLMITENKLGHEGKCEAFTKLGKKGSVPGVFNFTAWLESGYLETMTFHEVKEDEYAFIFIKVVTANCVGILTELIGRKQEVSETVKADFFTWTGGLGIGVENILFLPKEGGCTD